MAHRTLLACLVALSACTIVRGNGIEGTEEFDTVGARVLDLRNFVDVDITVGGTESATLRCEENLLEFIDVAVSGDRLTVRTVPSTTNLSATLPCEIDLVVTSLDEVSTSGAGDITSTATLDTVDDVSTSGSGDVDLAIAGGTDVVVRTSGSGNITIDDVRATDSVDARATGSGEIALDGLDVPDVTLSITGSGDGLLVGTTDRMELDLRGSGDVDASGLSAVDVDVRLAASGNADVRASGTVSGSLSGSGDLVVRGGADVNVRTTGSGDVSER